MGSLHHALHAVSSKVRAWGRVWHLLGLLVGLLAVVGVDAQPLDLTRLPPGSLGQQAEVLRESGAVLDLSAAIAQQHAGAFAPGERAVFNEGIGARPLWVHLALNNPTPDTLPMRLRVGVAWVGTIDAYLVQPGRATVVWHTGDERLGAPGVSAALGFTLETPFAPGPSDVYLRVHSVDPMVVPLELLTPAQALAEERLVYYGYGFIYGFLTALIAYNAMLFAGLGERSYLYYSLYLVSLVLMDWAYTGHGLALMWSQQVVFQRYVILVLMVLYSLSGLLFATRFLELAEHAPRVMALLKKVALGAVAVMGACVLVDWHLGATWVAFAFFLLFVLAMVWVGGLTVRHRRAAGRYFMVAVLFGMVGAVLTALAVIGWIPFTTFSYHALEVGVIMEATLLALALAYQMRRHQRASLQAQYLASHDVLTGLLNRRGFLDRARAAWSTAVRGGRPLSVILLDLDHFKKINDRHGHEAGDLALVEAARLLSVATRAGDMAARWGGEEFVLLLPETDLGQASAFAERVRLSLTARPLNLPTTTVPLTASFGVVQYDGHPSLEALIKDADQLLYRAKNQGRNRVMVHPPGHSAQAPLFE